MKKSYLLAALFAGITMNATATESTPIPHVFSSGDVIVASQMNENFSSLAAKITALEDMINTPAKTYQQLLSGSSYRGQFIFFGYVGNDDGNNGFSNSSRFLKGGGTFSLTLNADGSISNDIGQEQAIESQLTAVCQEYTGDSCTGGYSSEAILSTDQWNESSSTWSVNESTGIITISWDGDVNDTETFQASEDGSIIYTLNFINEVDGSRKIENSVGILVRQK